MRHLTSQSGSAEHRNLINCVRLALLKEVRESLRIRLDSSVAYMPLTLCQLLYGAHHHIDTYPVDLMIEEAANLRAYIAQELADGHTPHGMRNMHSYLYHAEMMPRRVNDQTIANLARQAWADRMIDRLKETLK